MGKGYNVKGPDGNLAVICGTVVKIKPGEFCNMEIAHVVIDELAKHEWPNHKHFAQLCPMIADDQGRIMRAARLDIEYGQCDHFVLLWRAKSEDTQTAQQAGPAVMAAPANKP